MNELYEEMKRENEAALEAELLARKHPDNLSKSLEAAEHFKRLTELSLQRAGDDARSEEKRLLDATMAEYFQAQSHKSTSWYAYQKRECDAALDELAKVTGHLNNAIREAESILESLSEDGKEFLAPQLQQWRVSLAGCPAAEYTIRARKAETAGKFVEAVDWYRHSVEEAQKAIEMGRDVPPTVNPAANRIMRGNMYSTVANSYKAMAHIMTEQAAKNGGSLGDDEGLQLLLCFLEAHRAGSIASAENPEWQQIGVATRSYSDAIRKFLRDNMGRWGAIYARFKGNGTLESIMHDLDPECYPMAKGDKILRENKGARLWAIGSFWVFAFGCVAGMVILLASVVSPWVVLPSIIGIEVILLIIGALTLRGTEDLSQTNFLKLVALAARFQLRSLLEFMKSKPTEGQANKAKEGE